MANHLKVLTRMTDRYIDSVMTNYNLTATLLNAVDVAKTSYEQRKGEFILSTIMNIPPELKLEPIDIDKQYCKDDLIRLYKTDTITKIATDYLVHTVAIIDAYIEDVYRYLRDNFSELLEGEKFDKLPWRNDSFRKLVNKIPLSKPKGRISTIEMTLDRCEEIRELRHAILHQRGEIKPSQIEKFKKFRERGERTLREQGLEGAFGTFVDFLIVDNVVKPNVLLIYAIRKWSYEFLFYMMKCYEETPVINAKKRKN